MQTYPRKKLEIVVEWTLVERVIEHLDRLGAPGYSVLPVLAGRGHGGVWRRNQISDAFHQVLVMVVAEETKARELMAELRTVLADYTAVLFLSEVEVIRPEHF